MSQIKTIFLDLDGVCCQWWETAHKLFPHAAPIPETGTLSYWVSEHIGVHKDIVDGAVNERGVDFWADLPEYPWFFDLYNGLCRVGPEVIFLTASGHFPFAPNGKLAWMQSRLGERFDDFVITRHKHLLANPFSILIDDSPAMIDSFSKAGGHGVMFPQRWNALHEFAGNPVPHVMMEIKKLVPFHVNMT